MNNFVWVVVDAQEHIRGICNTIDSARKHRKELLNEGFVNLNIEQYMVIK